MGALPLAVWRAVWETIRTSLITKACPVPSAQCPPTFRRIPGAPVHQKAADSSSPPGGNPLGSTCETDRRVQYCALHGLEHGLEHGWHGILMGSGSPSLPPVLLANNLALRYLVGQLINQNPPSQTFILYVVPNPPNTNLSG